MSHIAPHPEGNRMAQEYNISTVGNRPIERDVSYLLLRVNHIHNPSKRPSIQMLGSYVFTLIKKNLFLTRNENQTIIFFDVNEKSVFFSSLLIFLFLKSVAGYLYFCVCIFQVKMHLATNGEKNPATNILIYSP